VIQAYAKSSDVDKKWYLLSGQQKVALKVPDSESIRGLSEHARELDINYVLHQNGDTFPALILGPGQSSSIDQITGHLKLL